MQLNRMPLFVTKVPFVPFWVRCLWIAYMTSLLTKGATLLSLLRVSRAIASKEPLGKILEGKTPKEIGPRLAALRVFISIHIA